MTITKFIGIVILINMGIGMLADIMNMCQLHSTCCLLVIGTIVGTMISPLIYLDIKDNEKNW